MKDRKMGPDDSLSGANVRSENQRAAVLAVAQLHPVAQGVGGCPQHCGCESTCGCQMDMTYGEREIRE